MAGKSWNSEHHALFGNMANQSLPPISNTAAGKHAMLAHLLDLLIREMPGSERANRSQRQSSGFVKRASPVLM
jgi:hypothetical protein